MAYKKSRGRLLGDLFGNIHSASGQSSTDYGYSSGGHPSTNIIERFPFASDSNSTDHADLTQGRANPTGQQY